MKDKLFFSLYLCTRHQYHNDNSDTTPSQPLLSMIEWFLMCKLLLQTWTYFNCYFLLVTYIHTSHSYTFRVMQAYSLLWKPLLHKKLIPPSLDLFYHKMDDVLFHDYSEYMLSATALCVALTFIITIVAHWHLH